nr:helix-turn-helix domain-containing protein [Streptomyces sp. A1-5]
MRHSQGGGLTDEQRAFRERIRMEASEMFAGGQDNAVIARRLRVSVRSVQRWRGAWEEGGPPALRSQGVDGQVFPHVGRFERHIIPHPEST